MGEIVTCSPLDADGTGVSFSAHMGSASPRSCGGNLFQGQEGKQGQGERFCEIGKGAPVHADEPLRVEQAGL